MYTGSHDARPPPDRSEKAKRALPTHDGCGLEELLGLVGQPVNPREQHFLDRPRHHLGQAETSLLPDDPGELLQEERIPLGFGQDELGDGVRDLLHLEDRLDHAQAVLGRERLERHLGGVGLVHPGRPITRTGRAEKEHRGARDTLDDEGDALLRCFVAPVKVLQHQNDRLEPAALQAQLPEGVKRPALDRLGGQRRQAVRSLLHAEQLEGVRRTLLRIHLPLLEPRPNLLGHGLGLVSLGDPEEPAEDVEHREIRNGAPEGEAAPLQVRDFLPPEAVPELEKEAGLADAALADDPHLPAVSPGGQVQAALEQLQVVTPPDELDHPPAEPEPRALPPPEPVGLPRRLGEAPLQERRRRVAHDRRGGLAPRYQRLEDRPCLALRVEIDLRAAARYSDQELADVDPDLDRYRLLLDPPGALGGVVGPPCGVGGAARGGPPPPGSGPKAATRPDAPISSTRPPKLCTFSTTTSSARLVESGEAACWGPPTAARRG